MKKIALCFLLIASQLFATEYQAEFKAGYFLPTGSLFKEIYGGGGIYSLEFTRTFCGCFDGWMSFGYFSKDGYSVGEHTPTTVTLAPIGLGIKTYYSFNCCRLYAGLGAQAVYMHTHDYSPYVIEYVSNWGPGVIGKVGLLYHVCGNFDLDVFGDYSYCKVSFNNTNGGTVVRHNADVSGYSIGLGITYTFDTCK